ncbi:MAG: RES family NAD+ phosphorylase [Siphonobacter sp.]
MAVVYRIIREKFADQPLSTEGSRLYGGRWNPKGVGILYVTSTPELGLVEVVAHAPSVRYEDLPQYRLFAIEIPDSIRTYQREEMPSFWQDNTYEQTQHWLSDWLSRPDVLAIALPSVIVPFSFNILVHPLHPLFEEVNVLSQDRIPIDRRLWKRD